jgi:hypothetical protein
VENSHCHEADISSASQEIICSLWNSKLRYGDHNSPPPVPTLSQMISVHDLPYCFLKIRFNITAPSTHSLTICRMLIFTMGTLAHLQAVSDGLLLRSIPGGRLLRPKPEEAWWLGDKDRFNVTTGVIGLHNTAIPLKWRNFKANNFRLTRLKKKKVNEGTLK